MILKCYLLLGYHMLVKDFSHFPTNFILESTQNIPRAAAGIHPKHIKGKS